MKARLILEDGKCFEGTAFGASGTFTGEVVSNNSMMGYQQVITDPASAGLIVCMTYPLVGNYGINREDVESSRFFLKGLAVTEYCRHPSNFRSEGDLAAYMQENGIAGICGTDTRYLSRYLRKNGPLRGVLTDSGEPADTIISRLKSETGENLFNTFFKEENHCNHTGEAPDIAVIDLGARLSFIRALQSAGFKTITLPPFVTPEKINEINPKAVIIAGGPGSPRDLPETLIKNIKRLTGQFPLLGISLGMQAIAVAAGAPVRRLQKEHRGEAYPVMDTGSGRVYNTSQNRGFTLDADSLPPVFAVTHYNMHDGSAEGIGHNSEPVWGIEFWPYYHKKEGVFNPDLPEPFLKVIRGGSY